MTNQSTVAEIATAVPQSVRVFEKYQIDFCCGGKRPLEQACQERGISAAAVLDEIRTASAAEAAPERVWLDAELAELADYIVERHHAYLNRELPQIEARLDKVIANHAEKNPYLFRLQEVFQGLAGELTNHMRKEEMMLFPYVRQLEGGNGRPFAPFGTVANPIRMMLFEHDSAGAALAEMRRLTSGYAAPPEACPGFRALMNDLSNLESDLHQHIHLENNILFPRAIKAEQR